MTLSEYLIESTGTSDNSIYYRLARNVWNWICRGQYKHRAFSAIKNYNISKSNPRPGLLKWYRSTYPALLDSSQEIIPRKQWDIDGLIGQTENQIMHPHYDILQRYHCTHPDKRHDVLMIFECTNKKPYNSASANVSFLRQYDKYCDFANADYGLIPYAFCEYYPYRVDEWDHYAEGEYGSWWYREVSKINFKIFMEAWGYKKCIVIMQNEHPRQFITEIKEKNLYELGDKIDIVTNEEFEKKLHKKYDNVFGSPGLVITRMITLPETQLAINKAVRKTLKDIGGHEKDIQELNEMYNIINKNQDNISKALHQAGIGKEKSWAECPYDYKKSIIESYDNLITEESQHDWASKVSKLEKELDDIDIDIIKKQKIEKEMGDIDLVKNPDDLYKIYQWAWPCGKLLYWCKDKKLDDDLQKDYESLKKFMSSRKNWECIDKYFFYYKPITDKLEWTEDDVRKNALKIHFIEDHTDLLDNHVEWPE